MHHLRIHETVAGIAAGYRKPVTEAVNEAEGAFRKTHDFTSKDGQHSWRAGKNQSAGTWDHRHYKKNGNRWEHVKDHGYDGHESVEDAAASAKADCESYDKHGVDEGVFANKDIERQDKAIKAKAEKAKANKDKKKVTEEDEKDPKVDAKDADGGHDEAAEIQDDPTREKLETPKDEADEKKGGPAELAADLRVSIRIEKMGIGRYRRMLTKHELSADDEKWLKQRIADLEGCIKAMEDKLPALEKEAEGGTEEKKAEIKEGMKSDIRRAILELAIGK